MSSKDDHGRGPTPYPRVVVDGEAIVIIDEKDDREVYGYESDGTVARKIAEELQLELRSMGHIKSRFNGFMRDVADELHSIGLPPKVLENIFEEVYSEIYRNLSTYVRTLTRRSEKT
jgi:hypothetical protein